MVNFYKAFQVNQKLREDPELDNIQDVIFDDIQFKVYTATDKNTNW